jgi:GNAT superfamily N-acetyltransferase
MAGELFAEASRVFKLAMAHEMGCSTDDYESHELTVVERPAGSREPHLALATTCGTGTVLSVRDARLAEWARSYGVSPHFRAFLPSFLEALATRARELGYVDAKSHSASTGMVLASLPEPAPLPPGFRIRELARSEQDELRETKEFDNALLEPEERSKLARFRTAFAAVATDGTPAAVAGVWDQYQAIDEIGLDVRRHYRGLGLGHAMAVHATRWIREQVRWPIYTHGFTNIRSANTGLSAGFRPLWQLQAVYRPSDVE